MRKNTGKEETRARELFTGLWIPDEFMRRVESNAEWSLMCPNECPGLSDCWGEEFDQKYKKYGNIVCAELSCTNFNLINGKLLIIRYEEEGRYVRKVEARALWFAILDSQIETGTPYMLYKDSCNRKSNQQNLGTIKSSNLCTEVVEYTSPDEVLAVSTHSNFHLFRSCFSKS